VSILNRKLRRDLWHIKGMLAAVILIAAIGVSCLVGMMGTSENLQLARDVYYAQCRMADFWVDLKKMPVTELDVLGDLEGISEVRARIAFQVIVDLEGVEEPLSGTLLTLPPEPSPVINGILMQSGTYFTSRRQDEVIVSEAFAQARGITEGDTIHLIMNGQRKALFVVGTAMSSEFVYMMPPGAITPEPSRYGVFYVKRGFGEDALGFHGACNSLVGLLSQEARQDAQPLFDELRRRLKPYGLFAITPLSLQASNLNLSGELTGLATLSFFMPTIFLLVAVLVLNVLMSRLAQQQRTIVGTLKALGYRNLDIFFHFIQFGLFVGAGGALLGCLLGYWIADGLTIEYRMFFDFPKLDNRFYPGLNLVALTISLVFGVIGTLKGSRTVLNLNPAEAMRPPAPPGGGAVFLEGWTGLWRRLEFRWQIVLRNLIRNKGRTLTGIFSAAMGAALVLVTFGTMDSLQYMVSFRFDLVDHADYALTLLNDRGVEALYEAGELPGIQAVEPILDVPCHFQNGNQRKKGVIQGLVQNAQLTIPRSVSGARVPVPQTGLLMARRLGKELGLSPGDRVRVTPTQGLQRPVDLPVAGFIDSLFGLCVYADYNYLNRQISEAGAISSLQLKGLPTPGEMRGFLRQIKSWPDLANHSETRVQKRTMQNTFVNQMGQMVYPLILFGAVIFFGAILNGSLISIIERAREIATFRVLGYQPGEIGAIFLRENMIQYGIGAILGLPLGWWLLWGINSQYTNDMYSMPTLVAPVSWVKTVVLSFAFILGAHIFVRRAIQRLHWQDALSMKE
jgi:putative ABC transport system permease protein